MKLIFIILLAIFGAVAPSLQTDHGTEFVVPDEPADQPSLEQYQSMVEEIVKREEGPSATIPDVPTALYGAMGPKDTCMIDCKEDFPKAFVCWWYNNTRCFSCNLTSEDQSCLDECTCRKIGQTSGKNVAMPVILPGLSDTDISAIANSADAELPPAAATSATTNVYERDPDVDLGVIPFSCGSDEATKECADMGAYCTSEGISSYAGMCRKKCSCRNWDSGNPPSSNQRPYEQQRSAQPASAPPVGGVNCGDEELRDDCVYDHSTICTVEGISSNSDICRERCYCQGAHANLDRDTSRSVA